MVIPRSDSICGSSSGRQAHHKVPLPRELQLLTRAGLVTRTVDGRQVYFQAHRESPVFSELQRLLIKTVGARDVIRHALAPLSPALRAAFIMGSVAKGTMRASSDVDLLIVGDVSFGVGRVGARRRSTTSWTGREPDRLPTGRVCKEGADRHHFLTTVSASRRSSSSGPTMTLSDWQKNGWLIAHRTSAREIADLVAVIERDLADSAAQNVSADWRMTSPTTPRFRRRRRPWP